jgi:hypothetical protein
MYRKYLHHIHPSLLSSFTLPLLLLPSSYYDCFLYSWFSLFSCPLPQWNSFYGARVLLQIPEVKRRETLLEFFIMSYRSSNPIYVLNALADFLRMNIKYLHVYFFVSKLLFAFLLYNILATLGFFSAKYMLIWSSI